jgi:phosphonate transport system permease protein
VSEARSRPLVTYRSVTIGCVVLALAAGLCADLSVSALHPGAEFKRLLMGVAVPSFAAIEPRSVALTVAFAVLGVSSGATAGLVLALFFDRFRGIRIAAAILRSVHELFWALLLLQVTGLSPATGILAIALPYTGIFAKVFAEMIEEADLTATRVLPTGTSVVSRFAFGTLPAIANSMKTYVLYRFECGMRSTLVLGFIGLPTIGFNLESYFKEAHYSEAAALLICFYILIGTRRLWVRPVTVPFLVIGSLWALPGSTGGGSMLDNLKRFCEHDIVPAPLRDHALGDATTWSSLGRWAGHLVTGQMASGIVQTLVLAQIALLAAGVIALCAYPLVSQRFLGRLGHGLGRLLLVVARSTPEYMVAYLLLQIMGPSMLPAIVALALHNGAIIAYLLGRQTDGLDFRLDAPKGLGLYLYDSTPRLYGQFLAYLLYRWELILRESAIFGILGVKTIGYYVDASIAELHLDTALVLLVGVAGLTLAADAFSRGLRRRLKIDSLQTRLSSDLAPSYAMAG